MSDQNQDQAVHDDDKSGNNDKSSDDKQNVNMIPKHRFDEVNEKLKSSKAELQQVADELKQDVPEDMRELVPDLPPGQLIKWLRNANAKGLFAAKTVDALDTKRPNDQKTVNIDDLPTHQKMAAGYKQ